MFKNPLSNEMHMPDDLQNVINRAGTSSSRVSAMGAVVGAGFDFISANKADHGFLSDLAEEYRPEIAERLGLSAEQVTQLHFMQAFSENPILHQAKEATKTGKKTRLIAGGVSLAVGSAAGLGAAIFARKSQGDGQLQGQGQKNAAGIAGSLASTLGAMFSGRLTRHLIRRDNGASHLKGTAHGQIMAIKEKQQQGIPTNPADIFKVILALNPEIDVAIKNTLGKEFDKLETGQQLELIASQFPEDAQLYQEAAELINQGARPQFLIFGEIERVKAAGSKENPATRPVRAEPEQIVMKENPKEKESVSVQAPEENESFLDKKGAVEQIVRDAIAGKNLNEEKPATFAGKIEDQRTQEERPVPTR